MERLWRRLLAGVVVVCGFSGAALAGAATAATTTIDVGTDPAGGTISPAVMGGDFLQPFAGMGSFDSTTDEFEPSFLTDLSDDTFTGSIRFPGGIAADFYDWTRAIGPQSERTDNAYGPNTGPSPSTVGPDEFGQLLDETGASGVITTNFSTGTAQEAADLVSYMTGSSGAWATKRADNGHPQPYNVPMWEVGNEEQSPGNSWRAGTPVSVGGPSTCVGTADCEYIYGGTTSFTTQPVVGFADRSAGASDSTGAPNQSFFVKYPPVSPDSQTISVDGTQWTEVGSLADAGPNDDVYTIDDTAGEITFGDGTNGALPPAGAPITASYESGPHDGFVAFYEAMKAANPDIQVCAADTDTAFVEDAGSTIPYDCLQYHPYETATDTTGNIEAFEESVMNAPVNELATLQGWQSAIQSAAGHAIPLELSEYGSIMGDTPDPTWVPYYYDSLDEALLNASQLATWINTGISVADRQLLDAETPAVADVAVGLPGGAPFATTGGIVTPGPNAVGPDVLAEPDVAEPTAQYFQLFQPLAGGTLLASTTSNNPTLSQLMSGEAVGDLSVVAAANGDEIDTVVINRSPTDSVPTQLNLDGASDGPATMTTLNAMDGGDALSFNTSANPDAVSTTSSEGTVQNETLAATFPAHSISLVQVSVGSTPPPVPVSPPPVGGNPPAPSQPATGGTTPAATPVSSAGTSIPATISAKQVTPVTIQAIKLAGAKVIWCKRCTYPHTKLSFRLTGSAQVRISLLARKTVAKHRANVKTDWRQLAGVTVAAHKGANSFLVGKRWHKLLMPDTTMQILVQMKSARIWKTEKTLRLAVLAGHGHV